MLELNGCAGDVIKIGHETTLLVLGVEKDVVQFAITAPKRGVQPEEACQRLQAVQTPTAAEDKANQGSDG